MRVLVPARIREVVAEDGRRSLRFLTNAERHIGFRDTHQRFLNMGRRLMLGHHRLEAIDRREIILVLQIVTADFHLGRSNRILGDAHAVISVARVLAVRIARLESLQLGKGTAGIRLIAIGTDHVVEVGRDNDVMRQRGFFGAGVHRGIATSAGDRLLRLARAVIGVGRHHDRAACFRRIGMITVEIFEFLGRILVTATAHQLISVGKHLCRRIGVQQLRCVPG